MNKLLLITIFGSLITGCNITVSIEEPVELAEQEATDTSNDTTTETPDDTTTETPDDTTTETPDDSTTDETADPVIENSAPLISGTPMTNISEGESYTFIPTASDLDNDILTFNIENMPSWAAFDSSTGELSGTPLEAFDHQQIIISVSDGSLSTYLPAFNINVEAVETNTAPEITGNPATSVIQNSNYSFTPTANDIDGDNLTYMIINKPNWAQFDETTGTLTGTPTEVANHLQIIISVTDGAFTTSLPSFDINVERQNSAPIITGSPSTTATVSSSYQFIPTVTDIDNDTLTFSIVNKPDWATFNTTTGELSGTPVQEANHENIVINVSDGEATSALTAFNITVAAALYSITIDWQKPSENVNGETLDNISGYNISYGQTSGNYDQTIAVIGGEQISATIDNLEAGDYFFSMTTVMQSGLESDQSSEFYMQIGQ